MRVFIGLIALTMILTACSDDPGLVLDVTDDGTTVAATTGDRFTIVLEENPSTGYAWEVTEPDGVTLLDQRFETGDEDAIGSPGFASFDFEVTAAGTTTLVLEYRRPWLPDEDPDRVFTVTINAA